MSSFLIALFKTQHQTIFYKPPVSWVARPECCCKIGQPLKGTLEHYQRCHQCSKEKRKDETHKSWAQRQLFFFFFKGFCFGVFVYFFCLVCVCVVCWFHWFFCFLIFFPISPLSSEHEEVAPVLLPNPAQGVLNTGRQQAHCTPRLWLGTKVFKSQLSTKDY